MANWPIVRSQRTMPGTSTGVRANLSFDTGEAEVWRQMGNLGATITDIGQKFYLQQAEDQYSTATLQSRQTEADFAKYLSENPDETTYYKALNKHIAAQNRLRPKNPIAAKAFDGYMARRTIALKAATEEAKKDRLLDKFRAKTDVLVDEGVQANNPGPLREHIFSGISLGTIKEAAGMKVLREAENTIQYNSWLDYAKTHPREILESITTEGGKYRIGALPEIKDPGQVMAIKNIAMSAINEKERIKELLVTTHNKQMAKDAADFSISPREEWNKISRLEIDDNEKIKRFEVFTEARSSIVKGLSNPFDRTTDEILRKDMMERARNKTLTHKEINDAEGNGISTPDADKMRDELEGKSDSSKSAQEKKSENAISEIIKATPLGSIEYEEPLPAEFKTFALRKALRQYQDWRKAQTGPIKPRDDEYMALKIARDMKRDLEQRRFKSLEEFIPPIKPYEGLDIKKLEKLDRELTVEIQGIPQPKTKAEYDALSSGTVYIHPTLGRVVKQ